MVMTIIEKEYLEERKRKRNINRFTKIKWIQKEKLNRLNKNVLNRLKNRLGIY